MKALLFCLFLTFTLILIPSCAPATPKAPLVCAHPMFRGGQPFEVPSPYFYHHSGVLEFNIDDTHYITLSGAVCLWTK